jgi:integrase
LVLKLCGLLGLRPGEALALQWQDVLPEGLHVRRRVYRGKVDTPKSTKSTRIAALSTSVRDDVEEWRKKSPRTEPSDCVFASESGKTPVWPTNVWYDKIRPKLEGLGLSWVNYQVLRRSSATLMNQLGIDGKVVADQLGHGLNVSQNVYTQAGIARQTEAVNKLDEALTKKPAAAAGKSMKSSVKAGVELSGTTKKPKPSRRGLQLVHSSRVVGAGDRGRTGDVQLGKVTVD